MIEKEALILDPANYTQENVCLYSIAISLKRIADSLEQPVISGGDFIMPELTPEDIDNLKEHWSKAGGYEIK